MKALLRSLAAALAFVCCAGLGAPSPPSQRIDYVLTLVVHEGRLQAVQVDLSFRAQGDGETNLRLPAEWGGETELWRGIEDLTVVSGAEMRDGETPSERVLTHGPNARVHVRYRVVQDWDGAPAAGRNTYRPVIQPTYFHFIGEAAFVTPDLHNATPARLRVRGLPRGWSFASDLQHHGLVLGEIWASVTVGGDYRVHRARDRNIRVAMRGDWSFTDEAFTAEVARIVNGHRAFWRDRSSPYLVTVTQTYAADPGHLSLGGTGLGDAFAFFATANAEGALIVRTLAHESLHTWIPGQVGGMPEADEAAAYWFSEGFTDFYTGRLLVRQGIWTPQQFADDLNETLAAYARSPVRNAPNARIVADFWNDYGVQQLPYQRGRLLAAIWDARLRAAGMSLDEAMHRMRARALRDSLKAPELLVSVLDEMALDVRGDIAAHAEAGAPILLPEDVFAPCGRIVTREVPAFHRGFDIEATQAANGVIAGVEPNLPAYAAGMRDGMVLVRRDGGQIGDAEQELRYVVRDGGVERTISYYPRGRGSFALQKMIVEEPLEGERYAQCRAALAGV